MPAARRLYAVEQTLSEGGYSSEVIRQRMAFQEVMRERFEDIVEQATGRRVVGFMSGNQQDPDMICEVFVLAHNEVVQLTQAEAPCTIRRSLGPEPGAAGVARRALEEGLRPQIDGDLLERSLLAVTEVVTNSVKHAGLTATDTIDLQVGLSQDLLRIEVTDNGPGFDPLWVSPDPSHAASGGWGLGVVEQLTTRWGVDSGPATRVWLEFDLPPR
jgi:anti-sigma regulatory factor (Ser/Thr protein kinase)